MLQLYNIKTLFFYKEVSIFLFYGTLGTCKIRIPCVSDIQFYVCDSLFFFLKKKQAHIASSFFFKNLNRFILFLGSTVTSITTGYQLKFGPKGKRTRTLYGSFLFFFKLGYSSKIPFLLPLALFSNAKDKKERFYSVRGLDRDLLSNTLFTVSSFRSVDPYNFDGIMLKDGFFKFTNWSSKF